MVFIGWSGDAAKLSNASPDHTAIESRASTSLGLNCPKIRRKFLFIPATSSEFFAAYLVVIAITNENALGVFGR
jgi:hypothetical protein